MRQLVDSWLRAERENHGNSIARAIEGLNLELGSSTTDSRVSEWRRGVYVPSPQALSYMLNRTLPWALRSSGIRMSPDQQRVLEAKLWACYEKDGEPWYDLT